MELSKMLLWASMAFTTLALPRADGANANKVIEKKNDGALPTIIMRDGEPPIIMPAVAGRPAKWGPPTEVGDAPGINPRTNSTKPGKPCGDSDHENGLTCIQNPCETVRCGAGTTCIIDMNGHPTCAPGDPCGPTVCGPGTVCCNRSCGICTPPGGMCIQIACDLQYDTLPQDVPAEGN
ncbi:hypothetical protein ACRALDRAFT_1076976 [Sodiomyces alcalophilus JCM 7366]|uniref:uncharacterized protein n=1 Tax=Sodiomyces alcalophilus JCM 7366 TaxID=591952 RepID=UPI0039B46CF2